MKAMLHLYFDHIYALPSSIHGYRDLGRDALQASSNECRLWPMFDEYPTCRSVLQHYILVHLSNH